MDTKANGLAFPSILDLKHRATSFVLLSKMAADD